MKDKRIFLRIKFNSLMAEAHIIRRAERQAQVKGFTPLLNELRNHRVLVVRKQSRLTHLALGFIKGRTLEQMEGPSLKDLHRLPKADWDAINKMLLQYGPKGLRVGPWNADGSARRDEPAQVTGA